MLRRNNNDKGFTLIEMSIVMIIMGLLTASIFSAYNIYKKEQEIEITNKSQASILSALENYLSVYGRYPCPARYDAQRGDVAYGHAGDCTSTAVAVGNCDSGQCIYQSSAIRSADLGETKRVRHGVIPFKTLNLDEDSIDDGFGNRFSYIVTEDMAVDGGFEIQGGAIEVRNEAGITALKNEGSAHMLIISHGANGNGAFNSYGNRRPCNIAAIDGENCNLQTDAVFQTSSYNNNDNGYDDQVHYFGENDVPTWSYDYDNKTMDVVGSGTMGIRAAAGEFGDKVNVAGDVRATDGVMVTEICMNNNGGTDDDCFSPNLFVGSLDEGTGGITCGDGEYLVGIKNTKPICKSEITISCPAGYIMKGINNGQPICNVSPPSPCAAEEVAICDETYSLDQAAHGRTRYAYSYTTDYKGDKMLERYETYYCNNGDWQKRTNRWYYARGTCGCTGLEPRTNTHDTCSQYKYRGFYDMKYYTGNTYFEQTHSCLYGWSRYSPYKSRWQRTPPSDDCECSEFTAEVTSIVYDCPEYYTGHSLYRETQTCESNTRGVVSRVLDTDNCECNTVVPETQTEACGEYYVSGGEISTVPSYYNCDSEELIPADVDNQCVCNEGYVDDIDPVDAGACPDNYDGSRYYDTLIVSCGGDGDNVPTTSYGDEVNECFCTDGKEKLVDIQECPLSNYTGDIRVYDKLNCDTGEYEYERTDTNCSCRTGLTDTKKVGSCVGNIEGDYYATATLNCDTGEFGDYDDISNDCVCDDTKFIDIEGDCPDGDAEFGKLTTPNFLNCTNGEYDVEGTTTSTCGKYIYEWKPIESSNSNIEEDSISPYRVEDTCDKDYDYGFTGCYESGEMGMKKNYDSCICKSKKVFFEYP